MTTKTETLSDLFGLSDKIYYYRKSNYGTDAIYIADPAMAALISDLTGKKTVTTQDLAVLETLTGKEAVEKLTPRARIDYDHWTSPGKRQWQTLFARAKALDGPDYVEDFEVLR